MRQDVKKKWVEALRSGDYAKTEGFLHVVKPIQVANNIVKQPGFCCLGVLCELAIQDGVEFPVEVSPAGYVQYGAVRNQGVLPHEVMEWAGLQDNNVVVNLPDGTENFVSEVNDRHGKDFNYIADAIERTAL